MLNLPKLAWGTLAHRVDVKKNTEWRRQKGHPQVHDLSKIMDPVMRYLWWEGSLHWDLLGGTQGLVYQGRWGSQWMTDYCQIQLVILFLLHQQICYCNWLNCCQYLWISKVLHWIYFLELNPTLSFWYITAQGGCGWKISMQVKYQGWLSFKSHYLLKANNFQSCLSGPRLRLPTYCPDDHQELKCVKLHGPNWPRQEWSTPPPNRKRPPLTDWGQWTSSSWKRLVLP